MTKVIAIFILVLAAQTYYAQSAAPVRNGVESVYLARDDGNGKVGEKVQSFFTTDIPIYCIVELDSTKSVTVKMNFVAVTVPGVKSDSNVVTTTYTTKDGQNRVNFTGKPAEKWSAGRYRVDIFVDGKLVRDLVFDIRPSSGSPDGAAYLQPKAVLKARPAIRPRKNN